MLHCLLNIIIMHYTTVGELGVHSKNLINYFSAIPGTPAIKDNANPATYMLEVIGAGTTARINSQVTQYIVLILISAPF
jgi:hypothetical protein